jgi:hypothetical protein
MPTLPIPASTLATLLILPLQTPLLPCPPSPWVSTWMILSTSPMTLMLNNSLSGSFRPSSRLTLWVLWNGFLAPTSSGIKPMTRYWFTSAKRGLRRIWSKTTMLTFVKSPRTPLCTSLVFRSTPSLNPTKPTIVPPLLSANVNIRVSLVLLVGWLAAHVLTWPPSTPSCQRITTNHLTATGLPPSTFCTTSTQPLTMAFHSPRDSPRLFILTCPTTTNPTQRPTCMLFPPIRGLITVSQPIVTLVGARNWATLFGRVFSSPCSS